MKILVTGANGYLGRGIVEELLKRDFTVVATDMMFENIDFRLEQHEIDIFSIDNPYDFFGKPDVVLHLAWRNGFIHNDDSHIDDFSKHYHFLKKLVSSGLRQLAVLGTMHEIGFYEGSINEYTKTNPMSLYGISKNALRCAVEKLCQENDVCWQWLRGFYIVGNTTYGSSIFSKLMLAAEEGKEFFPFTSGQNQFDFIDYDEFCRQTVAIVSQKNIQGIINVCSGYPQKLSERVERFIEDNNLDIKLNYGAFPDRPYDSKAVWGDNSKIKNIIESDRESI